MKESEKELYMLHASLPTYRGCKQYMWWIEKYVKGDGGLE